MENEKMILKADIRRTPKSIVAVLTIIWYILGIIAFWIGTFGMSHSNKIHSTKDYYLFFLPVYKSFETKSILIPQN